MKAHVSAEAMARFRQGDLSQRRTSQISTHLAGCERCSALNEELGGVTTLLASVHPPPMPEHLAARITGALAAEAASRAAEPAARRGAAPSRSWRPRLPQVGSRVALGGLAAAAAVVVLAGGVYEIAVRSGGSTSSSSTASSAPAAAPQAGTKSPASGLMVPALPTFGPALGYQHAGRQASITPLTNGTDFTPARLASQATAAVAKYGAGFAKTGPNARPASHSGAAVTPGKQAAFGNVPVAALRGCVNRIAAGNLVLLVDVAHYRGTPATVIVTGAEVTGPMQIWVVGTGCSASRSDVLAHARATTP
jgi:hypothetical protein